MFDFLKRRLLPKPIKLADNNYPVKVSFCITHLNREEAIKQTLPQNLKDNIEDRHKVEFVLMDFNENDEIANWVKQHFEEYLKDGYLKYFRCRDMDSWHASVAKNTSHKVATGVVLVNLDGDNFTGYRGGRFVFDAFNRANHEIVLWQWSKVKRDGSFGRVAVTRDRFYALGGYDQSLMPMGYQDNDLYERARAMGAKLVHIKDRSYNKAIANDKYVPPTMKYEKMRDDNKRTSKRNIRSGILQANSGQFGLGGIEIMMQDGNMRPFDDIKEIEK